MRIDVVSDTICPWCYIGKRRLERALALRPGVVAEIAWRPFQLNPDMPQDGMDRDAYLRLKFGGSDRARAVYEPVRAAGEGEGIPFAFERIVRTPNTLASHRLIRWAGTAGRQDEVVEMLFRRYFLEGADLSAHETLVGVAREVGMDHEIVAKLLAKGADVDLVAGEDRAARAMGVTGVPFFVFDGKFAVPGAQDSEILAQVMDLALRGGEGEARATAD